MASFFHDTRHISEHLYKLLNGDQIGESIVLVENLHQRGISLSPDVIFQLLQGCARSKDLPGSRRVHSLILDSGVGFLPICSDNLVRLFAFSGSLLEASLVFCTVPCMSAYMWNAIIAAFADSGDSEKAFGLYHDMLRKGQAPDEVSMSCFLKACTTIEQVRFIHMQVVKSGFELDLVIGNSLISKYTLHCSLRDAELVFKKLSQRNVVTWSSMILGYATQGHEIHALQVFETMVREHIEPDQVTFLCVVKLCGVMRLLGHGRLLHDMLIKKNFISDLTVGTTLVDMYGKCGSMGEAQKVFDELSVKNAVSWGALIAGHVMNGSWYCALELFQRMQQEGNEPNKIMFLSMLSISGSSAAVAHGWLIHWEMICRGLDCDNTVVHSLVKMYVDCESFEDACSVLQTSSTHDSETWNMLVSAFSKHDSFEHAFKLVEKMIQSSVKPDEITFQCLLEACGSTLAIRKGLLIHDYIVRNSINSCIRIKSRLLEMYANCGRLCEAYKMLNELLDWKLEHEIEKDTILCMLRACGNMKVAYRGRLVHEHVIKLELEQDTIVGNTLVHMYASLGCMREAHKVFIHLLNKDNVSWGSIIGGYVQNGHGLAALQLFQLMEIEGLQPSEAIFSCALRACGITNNLEQGSLIHGRVECVGFASNILLANTLIGMYGAFGRFKEGHKVFDELPHRDVVSWGTLIESYAQHRQEAAAIQLYEEMQAQGFKPDKAVILCMLKVSGHLGAVREGRLLHNQIVSSGFTTDVVVATALFKMYSEFNSVTEAFKAMDATSNRDVVSWGMIISECGGNPLMLRQLFKDMRENGVNPNDEIHVNILSAFSHAGLFESGKWYFENLKTSNVTLSMEHYSCVIDLLGRTGLLDEADCLFQSIPIQPDSVMQLSFLTNCRSYGNLELYSRYQQQRLQDSSGS